MTTINIPMPVSKIYEYKVKSEDTSIHQHSGEVKVLGTPKLLAIMEEATCKIVKEFLPEGITTVGTEMHLYHKKPSVVGEKLFIECTLLSRQEKTLNYEIKVFDIRQEVGYCSCKRFLIVKEQFEQKAMEVSKKKQL